MIRLPANRIELARFIDHTLLKPEATAAQIDRLCDECIEHDFYSACVNPIWVSRCAQRLLDSDTTVCSVVGFPLGATPSAQKAYEALEAVEAGAREIDMVIHIGALVAGDVFEVARDIAAVVDTVKRADADALVKVILETAALTEPQIVMACRCAAEAQADFVKTSTGFHPAGGATVEHVALLYKTAAPIRVKASGGIRDHATAMAMIQAGASRIGASASAVILSGMEA